MVTSSALPMVNGSRAFRSSRPNDADRAEVGDRSYKAKIGDRSRGALLENRWSRRKTLPSVASLYQ
jgi:hypothetical protein